MLEAGQYSHLLTSNGMNALLQQTGADFPLVPGSNKPESEVFASAIRRAAAISAPPGSYPECVARILDVLLKTKSPIDVREIASQTGFSTYQLSWRLMQMTKHEHISRKKLSRGGDGERYVYFLSDEQGLKASSTIGPCTKNLASSEGFDSIFKALIDAPDHKLDFSSLAKATTLAQKELRWRLTFLTRVSHISRSRAKASAPYSYFLSYEQLTEATVRLAPSADAAQLDPKVLKKRKRMLAKTLKSVEAQLEATATEVTLLEQTLATREKELELAKAKSIELTSLNAIALVRAQSDPIALSERLSFLSKLRARPALEPLALLKEIEDDYSQALTMARSE